MMRFGVKFGDGFRAFFITFDSQTLFVFYSATETNSIRRVSFLQRFIRHKNSIRFDRAVSQKRRNNQPEQAFNQEKQKSEHAEAFEPTGENIRLFVIFRHLIV